MIHLLETLKLDLFCSFTAGRQRPELIADKDDAAAEVGFNPQETWATFN
jgi:hypothetical protein